MQRKRGNRMSVWEKLSGIQGKAAAVLIIVFLAGGGTGYFAGRWHASQERIGSESAQKARFSQRLGKRDFIQRLETDLGLQADQMKRVRSTLRQHHEKMREIRSQMRPQINGILEQARGEIRILLNADQQRTFDKMVQDYKERRRMRRERWNRMMRDRDR